MLLRKNPKKIRKIKFIKKERSWGTKFGDLATFLPINRSFQHIQKGGGNFETLEKNTGAKIINAAAPSTTTRPTTRSRGEEDETHVKLTRNKVDPKKEKGKKTVNRFGPKKKEILKSTACCYSQRQDQYITRKSLTRPVYLVFLVTLN